MCISTKHCLSSNQCKELVSLLTCEEAVREVYLHKHYSYHFQTLFFSASCSVVKLHCDHCCFRTLQVYVPIRQFFYNLIHPDYSAVTDVYVLMFLADTVDFIIIVFGFWAFGVCHRGHLYVNCQLGPLTLVDARFRVSVVFPQQLCNIFLFRNTLQQQTSPLHYQRTRSQRRFW